LEQVVIQPIHERDLDWGPSQDPGREEPPEPAPDDDDAVRAALGPGCRCLRRALHAVRRSYATTKTDRSSTLVAK
jgi:hypothetical protein